MNHSGRAGGALLERSELEPETLLRGPEPEALLRGPEPEAQERLRAVLERIRSETGVTLKDMQDLDTIDPTMFNDTTHLGRYLGDVAFTDHLVNEYAGRLGANEN